MQIGEVLSPGCLFFGSACFLRLFVWWLLVCGEFLFFLAVQDGGRGFGFDLIVFFSGAGKLARPTTTVTKRRPSIDLGSSKDVMTPGAKEFGSPVAKKKVVPIIAVIIALLLLIFAYNTLTSTKKVYGLMIDAGSTGTITRTFVPMSPRGSAEPLCRRQH